MRFAPGLPLVLLACSSTVLPSPPADVPRVTTDVPAVRDVPSVTDVPAAADVPAVTDVPAPLDAGEPPEDAPPPPPEDTPPPPPEDTPPPPPEDVPRSTSDYALAGPFTTRALSANLMAAPTTGCTGTLCNVTLSVTLPAAAVPGRASPWPLAVFSNGFSTASTAYAATATRLASWGYVVVRYDLQGESFLNAATHDALANIHGAIIDWARLQGESGMLRGLVDTTRVIATGHSRGGKIAALAATRDPRIVAVVGLDPVDSPPPFQQPSEAFPLASARLRALGREVPLVAIGAEFGGRSPVGMPCAPMQYNYATFFDAARGPGLEVVLREAGHGQFVDDDRAAGASALLCPAGSAMNETVRAISRTLLVAWAERFTRNADITPWIQGAWLQARVADRTFASVRRR